MNFLIMLLVIFDISYTISQVNKSRVKENELRELKIEVENLNYQLNQCKILYRGDL